MEATEFTPQRKDDIQARMCADFRAVSGKASVEGSMSRDLINASSEEFQTAYAELNLAMAANYATTAWGKYLTARAEEYGVIRKAATAAVGVATFSGAPGRPVPVGALLSDGQNVFLTTEPGTIGSGGHADIAIAARTPGSAGNVPAGAIGTIAVPVPGVASVTNAAPTADGSDQETDDELRDRYLFKMRNPHTSGNVGDYVYWARSVPGVGAVKVWPLWNGNGTVKVYVLNSAGQPAGADLLRRVAAFIEGERPIGATVTVAAPALATINISAAIANPLRAGQLDEIRDAIAAYLMAKVFSLTEVVRHDIGMILMQHGVGDYSELRLNGQRANVDLSGDEFMPVVGAITLTEAPT